MKVSNIKVAVRLRPLLPEEEKSGHQTSKVQADEQNQRIISYNERQGQYKEAAFDYVFGTQTSQQEIFEKTQINEFVNKVTDGYHATVFAYGQTGSGKTFTMEGYKYVANDKGVPQPEIKSDENEGLVPRSVNHLFDLIQQKSADGKKKYTVYCSFLQIYKEKIFDLLNKSQVKALVQEGPGLKLRWNKDDHFIVENLYTFECKNPEAVMQLFYMGIKSRVVASHNMNNASSRSHTILSLSVEQVDVKNPDAVIHSKLQLVDLAGSERQSMTGQGPNKESIEINKSLFTLRQVITALTEGSQSNKKEYIPYRDSKLTSLLRQSLGGNSYCLMIACLTPSDSYLDENLSTLQYASRAQTIHNKPVRNEDPRQKIIEDQKIQIIQLTEELSKANETIKFLSQSIETLQSTATCNIKSHQDILKQPKQQNAQNIAYELDSKTNELILEMPRDEFTDSMEKKGKRNKLNGKGVTQEIHNQPLTQLQRQGSASSAVTEKAFEVQNNISGQRTIVDKRQIITERVIHEKEDINKFFLEKGQQLQQISTGQTVPDNLLSNQQKDQITERIAHTVKMMKEVLQSNLALREKIQKQTETIDDLHGDLWQQRNENEDLRGRLQVLEEASGKDSQIELARIASEKKQLEHRVKQLENTQGNWNQFSQSRQQFHQRSSMQRQNTSGKRATLDENCNDDYEPVMCLLDQGNSKGHVIELDEELEDEDEMGNIVQLDTRAPKILHVSASVERPNNMRDTSKGKKFLYQQRGNVQKSVQNKKSLKDTSNTQKLLAEQAQSHQDYKIRTVRSLAMAQQVNNMKNSTSSKQSSGRQNQKAAAYKNTGPSNTTKNSQLGSIAFSKDRQAQLEHTYIAQFEQQSSLPEFKKSGQNQRFTTSGERGLRDQLNKTEISDRPTKGNRSYLDPSKTEYGGMQKPPKSPNAYSSSQNSRHKVVQEANRLKSDGEESDFLSSQLDHSGKGQVFYPQITKSPKGKEEVREDESPSFRLGGAAIITSSGKNSQMNQFDVGLPSIQNSGSKKMPK